VLTFVYLVWMLVGSLRDTHQLLHGKSSILPLFFYHAGDADEGDSFQREPMDLKEIDDIASKVKLRLVKEPNLCGFSPSFTDRTTPL
jgi:hypothetical protein